jgi:hypothetical protein
MQTMCIHDGNVVNAQEKQRGTRREGLGSEMGRAFVLSRAGCLLKPCGLSQPQYSS